MFLVDLLQRIVIYKEDNDWDYVGLRPRRKFNIFLKNGKCISISPNNPLIIINESGYTTKYRPCEDISQFYDTCIMKYQG